MKRKYISAGNWKLNLLPDEAVALAGKLHPPTNSEVIIAPVFTCLSLVDSIIKSTSISLAAQNCYQQESGAFTGEVSTNQLKAVGCTHIIIGHSERRTLFHEDDKGVRDKVKATINENLVPILCVGETLRERENGQVENVLSRQLTYGLEGIDLDGVDLIVAYEPVWAIGTGKVASKEDAQKAHQFIRKTLASLYNEEKAESIRILYGGSVKPDNIEELIEQADIDGALVGGASLKAESFNGIIDAIEKAG